MSNSPLAASIDILDDYSLLNVFYLYRSSFLDKDGGEAQRLVGSEGLVYGRWWYTLAHVCQRWRNIVLGSAAYLGVSLLCTNGTPVADMLAHSPLLPLLVIYHLDKNDDFTAQNEEGATLALKQYDRVRRVYLMMPTSSMVLQKLIDVMDGEYPILEYLIMGKADVGQSSISHFPETLQVPHLRQLTLMGFALPMGSRLLTTAIGLVSLYLYMVHPSTYVPPNTLQQCLPFMPRLETLMIIFSFPVSNREAEMQLTHTPVTPVTFPNLQIFTFKGVTTYLEALAHRITAPRLEKLQIIFFNERTFSFPRLLQFMNTAENLRFKSAKIEFSDEEVDVEMYPHKEAKMHALVIAVECCHLDWQVSSAAQISSSLSSTFSAVEHLTLEHEAHIRSSEEHNHADLAEWRELLGAYRNVKALRIGNGLVKELSRCLQMDDGELPLGVLPELQELTYFGSENTGDTFTSFVDARQNAGRPITLIRS